MTISGEKLAALTEAFHNAAIDGDGWHGPLQDLAELTGSRSGQLLGMGAVNGRDIDGENFNIITGIDPGLADRFITAGANDPAHNPRVRAGLAAPVLEVLTEVDFLDPDEHRHHPHFRELANPLDIPHSCLTPLLRREGLMIGLAVLRSASQGPIHHAQRAAFQAAAPMAGAAVRMQIALENQGETLLRGALEGMSVAGFLCDRTGAVRALTPAAERLADRGGDLQLRKGRLVLPGDAETARLNEAVLAGTEAAGRHRQVIQTLICQSADGDPGLVLEVMALPAREYEMTFAPRVLVTASRRGEAPRSSAAGLRAAYGLTEAEADIALRLSSGQSPGEIADVRHVVVGTVRTQIKTVLAKLGVKRQAELVALLARLR